MADQGPSLRGARRELTKLARCKMTIDDDPIVDFNLTEIRNETSIGICVKLGDDIVWIPKADCQWTKTTISMKRSVAKRHFIL